MRIICGSSTNPCGSIEMGRKGWKENREWIMLEMEEGSWEGL